MRVPERRGRDGDGPGSVLLLGGGAGGVCPVGLVAGEGAAVVAVVVLLRVVGVGYHLVALALLLRAQQLLEADEGGQHEGQLAHDEGLQGEEGQGAECQRDDGGCLQFHHQEEGQQHLQLLLLSPS